jgi:hypothetical protein
MQRPRFRSAPPASLLGVLLAVLLVFVTPANAASPTPTPSGSTGSSAGSSTAAKPPPTVTFGLGPSDGKKLDGRPGFIYTASPGSVINDHVALVNISAQPLTLLLYATDAQEAIGGTLSYEPFAAKHLGASLWLALPEVNGSPEIRIRARSTLILPFQVRVPDNASPGDHTAGIAVGLVANVAGKITKNLHFEQRVVAEVAIRVSGIAVAKLQIEKLQATYNNLWNPFGQGSITLTYSVLNAGNVNLGAEQVAKLSGLFGNTGTVPKLPEISELLPGAAARFRVHISGVWPEFLLSGSVRVTPIGVSGTVVPTLHVASASTSVWAIPWALIILILILVGGGYALRRYQRKRAVSRRKPSHSRSKSGAKEESDS